MSILFIVICTCRIWWGWCEGFEIRVGLACFHACLFNSLLMGFDFLNVIIIYIICCLFLHSTKNYRSTYPTEKKITQTNTHTIHLRAVRRSRNENSFVDTEHICIYDCHQFICQKKEMPSINTQGNCFFFFVGCAFLYVLLFVLDGKCHWNGWEV